jgi:hypothetical protein
MQPTTNDTSAEAIIKRAQEIYERNIRSREEPVNHGRVVAIDVDSEQYEVGDHVLEVSDRLRARIPNATVALLRIGEKGLYRIGHFPIGSIKK